jgi:dienelactone hydrolase
VCAALPASGLVCNNDHPGVFIGCTAARHGCHADYRPSYRKEAAEDAWKEMLAFFKKNRVLSCIS